MTATKRARANWLLGITLLLLSAALFALYRRYLWAAEPFEFEHEGLHYELVQPRVLGLLLVLPLLIWGILRSLADLPWQQRLLALLVRTLFLATLALALAGLVRTAEANKICLVLLVDVSDSVPDVALENARARISEALASKGKDDLVRVIAFAERPRLLDLEPEAGKPAAAPSLVQLRSLGTDGLSEAERKAATVGTNLQAALQLAYGVFPPGYLKRALILSDGVETAGDVLAEVSRAEQFQVQVSTLPYRFPVPGEVAVRSLRVPDKVEIGTPFLVVAEIYSSRESKARARLYQGEALNGLGGVRELTLKPGSNEVVFESVVRFGGEVTYKLDVDQISEDKFPENNGYSATLDVPGRPAVLYVEGQPQHASYLSSALTAQQFDVDVRGPTAFPGSLAELERYSMVIVSDVPAEKLSLSSQDLIERYVKDIGGGFLFAGGEAGYGLGGWSHTTIERILPVRMDIQRRKDIPSVALALVIDRSGSMTGLPMEMAKAACRATVGTLQGDDLIEIIAFDSVPRRYVKMEPARYRSRIQNEIAQIQPGGGTAIFPALDAAYQDISVVQARKKHVILLTDGRADSHGVRDLVQAMVAENVTVTTVGLGDGADSDFLRMIADAGAGRYHHVPDPNNLPRIFTRETEMISRQAAVEDWFPVTQTGNADFLQGIAINSAPLLHGYVATEMKAAPAQELLASDKGEPILARLRVGLGYTLAWTSDVKNNWAVDWLRWSGFSRFWGQLVHEHMRKKHRRELDMRTELVAGKAHVTIDAFSGEERFENELVPKLFLSGPTPKGERSEVAMRQTAPGRYEAWFDLNRYGSFLLKAELFRETEQGELRPTAVSYGQLSNPYPNEYASFEPDLERLERVASAGRGALDPSFEALLDPKGDKITYREALWKNFVYLALALFLIDLLLRRVRIFDRKFIAGRRRVHGMSH